MILFHFTCEHSRSGIEDSGKLIPHPHPLLPELGPVVWLTDLSQVESRRHLGLTQTFIHCDRMAHRFQVDSEHTIWWPLVRGNCDPQTVRYLEQEGRPSHWWVSKVPLEVIR